MGLDMYLEGNKYVSEYFDPELKKSVGTLFASSSLSDKVCGINFQLAYWRKANSIHKWFVDNVQKGVDDCGRYYVNRDLLQKLVDTCKEVLTNRSLAMELLPPQSGFFFGNTEVGEWYFEDLNNTINQLEPLLKGDLLEGLDIYYHSSW